MFTRFLKGQRPLLLLNLCLLAAVVVTFWGGDAGAQNANPGPEGRARGDYTLISGKTISGGADAIYVLDAANQELVALRWDGGKQSLTGIGYRNLTADAKSSPGR